MGCLYSHEISSNAEFYIHSRPKDCSRESAIVFVPLP